MSEAIVAGNEFDGIETLEDLEAPGFWEWAAGIGAGVVVGGGAVWIGVAIT